MKHIAQLLGTTIIAIFMLAAPQMVTASGSFEERLQAKKAVEEYFAALNASRLETIISLYHQESVFLPKNAPAARGLAEIAQAYRALFETAKLDTEHVYQHVAVYGDVAIIESQGHGTLTLLASKRVVPSNNKELFILRKIDGKWKIDRYMFNDSEKPSA
jgi:uncharacterized protein (TIGR02246 family)